MGILKFSEVLHVVEKVNCVGMNQRVSFQYVNEIFCVKIAMNLQLANMQDIKVTLNMKVFCEC